MKVCVWKHDEPYEYHSTSCGREFSFIDGNVKENGYKFCPNCGKNIQTLEL